MIDLPFGTHRNLIQPLTGSVHIKLIPIRRFLCIMDKVENCKKDALKMLSKKGRQINNWFKLLEYHASFNNI